MIHNNNNRSPLQVLGAFNDDLDACHMNHHPSVEVACRPETEKAISSQQSFANAENEAVRNYYRKQKVRYDTVDVEAKVLW